MSVRVNLLPKVSKQAQSASRMRGLLIGFAVLVLAGLSVASLLQNMTRGDARDALAEAQRERALAQSAVDELAAFAELEQDLEEAEAVVQAALGRQASLAGVLQDLALATPEDVALTGLTVDMNVDGEGAGLGILRASAETLNGIAPGVERYLRGLEQFAGFEAVYLASATTDDQDITVFELDLILGEEHLTRRFDTAGVNGEVAP
jgi:Tfp pilus assembly protein PilN